MSPTPQTGVTFSVVIPVHNKGPHIARSIGSVLKQSFGDFELIVIDDASTDNSAEEIAKFDDPRIRMLRRAPAGPGPSGARNLGIRSALGEFVAFLDADDEWLPDFLVELKGMIEGQPHADVLATGYLIDHGNGPRPDCFSPTFTDGKPRCLDFKSFVETWLRLQECPVCTSAIAIRRNVLLEAGGFPEGWRRGEDKETWLRAVRGRTLCFSPARLAIYFKDSVNMATGAALNEKSHCVCATLGSWIGTEQDPKLRRDLKQLNNLEIRSYARVNARRLHRGPDLSGSFYPEANPLRYAEICLLRLAPLPLLRALKGAKSMFGRRTQIS